MAEMKLTLKLKEVEVTLEDQEGNEKIYFLRELSGKARDEYLTSMTGRMKYDLKGNPIGLKNFDGLQSCLLKRSLYDESGNLVDEKTIQTFPSTAQNALFKKAQELSALDEASVAAAKNE